MWLVQQDAHTVRVSCVSNRVFEACSVAATDAETLLVVVTEKESAEH